MKKGLAVNTHIHIKNACEHHKSATYSLAIAIVLAPIFSQIHIKAKRTKQQQRKKGKSLWRENVLISFLFVFCVPNKRLKSAAIQNCLNNWTYVEVSLFSIGKWTDYPGALSGYQVFFVGWSTCEAFSWFNNVEQGENKHTIIDQLMFLWIIQYLIVERISTKKTG